MPVAFDSPVEAGVYALVAVSGGGGAPVAIDPQLLEILICPACHGAISETTGADGLECAKCGRIYPVRDGIPVMLVDEASPPTRGDRP